jgi:DNA polymerase-3 subunit gamma/tau
MTDVLYRKYRARSFAELVGQDHVAAVLKQSILNGKPAHAYLFSGPRGTGKTSTARLLAKALNCENFSTTGDVCGQCDSCVAADSQNSMHVIEVDAASNRGINEIRQIREAVNYSTGSQHKTYIIDEVHMLSNDAFNALLKTLEEPPAHVVFVLATTELHKVPATILSRVQHFQFKLGSSDQVLSKLERILSNEGYTAPAEVLQSIYELTEGSYRDAESLLNKLLSGLANSNKNITIDDYYSITGVPSKQIISTYINCLTAKDTLGALQQLQQLETQGISWQYFVKQLLTTIKQSIVANLEASQGIEQYTELMRAFTGLYAEVRDLGSAKLAIETQTILLTQQSRVVAAATAPTVSPAKTASTTSSQTYSSTVQPAKPLLTKSISPQATPEPREQSAEAAIESVGSFSADKFWQQVKKQNIAVWVKLKSVSIAVVDGQIQLEFTDPSAYRIAQQYIDILKSAAKQFNYTEVILLISNSIAAEAIATAGNPSAITEFHKDPNDNSDLVEQIL